MRILFIQETCGLGGVNVVTKELANFFVKKGHIVSAIFFAPQKKGIENEFDNSIKLYMGSGTDKLQLSNIRFIRNALKEFKPDIVINNWGLRVWVVLQIRLASIGLKRFHLVSEYHTAPAANNRVLQINLQLKKESNKYRRLALSFLKVIQTIITSNALKLSYKWSDKFILLSDTFFEEFRSFTHQRKIKKIIAIPNPNTVCNDGFQLDTGKKLKEILYVGRLEPDVKKPMRVVEAWNMLYKKFPEWHLTIVGDGPERKTIDDYIYRNKLPRIECVGRQNPKDYYERASIVTLTSDFEGFGLVLVEGMAFGVVPVAYGSYSSVTDIIDHDKNGLILEPINDGFDMNGFTDILSGLMSDDHKRVELMNNAYIKSRQFDIDNIYRIWETKLLSKN